MILSPLRAAGTLSISSAAVSVVRLWLCCAPGQSPQFCWLLCCLLRCAVSLPLTCSPSLRSSVGRKLMANSYLPLALLVLVAAINAQPTCPSSATATSCYDGFVAPTPSSANAIAYLQTSLGGSGSSVVKVVNNNASSVCYTFTAMCPAMVGFLSSNSGLTSSPLTAGNCPIGSSATFYLGLSTKEPLLEPLLEPLRNPYWNPLYNRALK